MSGSFCYGRKTLVLPGSWPVARNGMHMPETDMPNPFLTMVALAGGVTLSSPAFADSQGVVSRLDLSEWVGKWVASEEQQIFVTMPDKKGLRIDGMATYGALDPERVERGAVNVGEFSIRIPSRWVSANNQIDIAINADGEAVPVEEADDYDCMLSLRLDWNVNWIDVIDNNMCGGLNVSFTGRYEWQDAARPSLQGNSGITSYAGGRTEMAQRPAGVLRGA